jgi:hypothetical protein
MEHAVAYACLCLPMLAYACLWWMASCRITWCQHDIIDPTNGDIAFDVNIVKKWYLPQFHARKEPPRCPFSVCSFLHGYHWTAHSRGQQSQLVAIWAEPGGHMPSMQSGVGSCKLEVADGMVDQLGRPCRPVVVPSKSSRLGFISGMIMIVLSTL